MDVASALSNTHIPYLVKGTDAIHFIHRPSGPQFIVYLRLLLADANIQSGAEGLVISVNANRERTPRCFLIYLNEA